MYVISELKSESPMNGLIRANGDRTSAVVRALGNKKSSTGVGACIGGGGVRSG
jgi:hypothetical protein